MTSSASAHVNSSFMSDSVEITDLTYPFSREGVACVRTYLIFVEEEVEVQCLEMFFEWMVTEMM